ncbi:MotA/TolQ/ExbB proton channel family protein [Phormidesmis priestleyi]
MLDAFLKMPLSGQVLVGLTLLLFVISTACIAERIRFWMRVTQRHPVFAKEIIKLYQHQPELVAEKIKRNIDLPIARIFAAALELDNPNPEEFRLAMESELQAEIPTMKRFGGVLELTVGLAPMLGLIGTITGLIAAFGSLNIGDIGGTKTAGVSSGISEALITTAVGLVVAATCLVFATIFRNIYNRQMALIQEYGGQLELVYRRRSGRDNSQSMIMSELSDAIRQLAAKGKL